jgi:dephospho-CoA kinase
MLKVGLTGNIGSGKTLVAGIFKTFTVPVFDADGEAKAILQSVEMLGKLRSLFGEIIFENGAINRKVLAEIVFGDSEKLNQLNALIHPKVRERFDNWVHQHQRSPYIIYEAAILIETGFYKQLDRIIIVTADEELRINRVMQRDKVAREMVHRRMDRQWDETKKIPFADFIIQNNNNRLIPQALNIHETLIGSAMT